MSILSAVGHAVENLNPFNGLIQQSSSNNYLNPAVHPATTSTPKPAAPKAAAPTPTPTVTKTTPQTTPTKTYVDPYAGTVFGSTAGYNQAVSDYNSLHDTTLNSINNGIGQSAQDYNSGILDYLDSRKTSQGNINTEATQNELARQQGVQGINDMVGNGIKSSGALLANDGAGNSSAGDALAKAYGTIARQQLSGVDNQAAQGQAKIDNDEAALVAGDATQQRHTQESKTSTINTIVNSATQSLASLNQAAATASLPQRVQIDQQIATIKQQAMDALSAYDAELTGGIAAQPINTASQTKAAASGLLNAGTAPEDSFNYTTDVPASLQNTGQFASSLPIFTGNTKKNNNQP